MSCIKVSDLRKDYVVHRKEPGLSNAVKSLFVRKKEVKTAVNNISFEVEHGEFVGFIGPNGAGKTTTIKMLSGILFPSSGEVEVIGFRPCERKNKFLRQITFVMGNKSQLWWDLPTIDALYLLKDIYQVPDEPFKKSVDLLTDLLGLGKLIDVQVRKLSLGERMKCELMASIIHMPKVIFLDEPTIGLDIISQKAMREFLKQYNRETGATIILTSHYLEDIKALCDRIVFINSGSIIYDGKMTELMNEFAREVIIKCVFTGPLASADCNRLAGLGEIIDNTDNIEIALRVLRHDGPRVSAAITSDFPIDDLLIEEMPLDRIVARMYTNEAVG